MSRILALALIPLALAGCATTAAENQKLAQADGTKEFCEKETPTGSMRIVSKCRTAAQREAEQRNAQDFIQNQITRGKGVAGNPNN